MEISKYWITDGLERESSLLSVNLQDKNGVSMYDRVFIDRDEILYGAINEAVSTLTQNMQEFVTSYEETNNSFIWTLSKTPYGLHDDIMSYIVNYTMNEWCIKALKDKDNSFVGRANISLKNVLKKLYFKPRPA